MLGAIALLGCGSDEESSGPHIWTCECTMSGVRTHADLCSEGDPAEEATVSCTCTESDQSCTPEANALDAGFGSPLADD